MERGYGIDEGDYIKDIEIFKGIIERIFKEK
jgi:hypothetical protein